MIYKYIVNIGDSLTTGARDEFNCNYGFYLAEQLTIETNTIWHCIQRAETGFTIEDIRRRIHDYCYTAPEASIATLLIGTNDAKGAGTTPNMFKRKYNQIIDVCLMQEKYLIICTIPQIMFGNMPEHFGRKVNKYINEYNAIIKELAFLRGINLCDLSKHITLKHLVDGVHLNNDGNIVIAKAITNSLIGEENGTIR